MGQCLASLLRGQTEHCLRPYLHFYPQSQSQKGVVHPFVEQREIGGKFHVNYC